MQIIWRDHLSHIRFPANGIRSVTYNEFSLIYIYMPEISNTNIVFC